jgi:hypothetical protein
MMTDYRDVHNQRLSSAHQRAYGHANENSTSLGGVLIGLAIIGLVFLGLTLFFGNGTGNAPVDATIEQTAPTAPTNNPATTD